MQEYGLRKYVPRKSKTCIICGKHFITNQYQKKYCSKKCKRKANTKTQNAKREKRGFDPLISNHFPKEIDVDFHHIHFNLPFVIPIPKDLHQQKNGNVESHFRIANEWVEFYYDINVNDLLEVC